MRTISVALCGALSCILPVAAAASPPVLASHRAVYDISLLEAGDGTDVTGVTGRLVLEFTGSECVGYSSKLRFVTETEDADGGLQMTDSRSSTFETADGRSLDFNNETYAGDILAEQSEGKASRDGDDVSVALTRPGKKRFVLKDTVVFPTQQMERIITSALEGDAFVSFEVYDGSESGETVFDTAGVIGKVSTAGERCRRRAGGGQGRHRRHAALAGDDQLLRQARRRARRRRSTSSPSWSTRTASAGRCGSTTASSRCPGS